MCWIELTLGIVLVIAGIACFRGHRALDSWSYRIWTVPSDSNPSVRFRTLSSFVVAVLISVLGIWLVSISFF